MLAGGIIFLFTRITEAVEFVLHGCGRCCNSWFITAKQAVEEALSLLLHSNLLHSWFLQGIFVLDLLWLSPGSSLPLVGTPWYLGLYTTQLWYFGSFVSILSIAAGVGVRPQYMRIWWWLWGFAFRKFKFNPQNWTTQRHCVIWTWVRFMNRRASQMWVFMQLQRLSQILSILRWAFTLKLQTRPLY